MKNTMLSLFALVLASTAVNAQEYNSEKGVLERITIEGSYGYNLAMNPTETIEVMDYSKFGTFQLGVRVDLDKTWGLRGTYTNTSFENKNNTDFGIKIHQIVAEATYNFISPKKKTEFQLMGHSGFGLGSIKSNQLGGDDLIGIFQIGLMPEYSFTNQFSVFLDVTYKMNFSQNYLYNGFATDKNTGSYLLPSLGFSYKFMK